MDSRGRLFAFALVCALLAPALFAASPAVADGELVVSLVDSVAADDYPALTMRVSAVDSATGRPIGQVQAAGIAVRDAAGPAAVQSVEPAVDQNTPVAFAVLLDTGGAMAPHIDRARAVLRELLAGLGPNDVVRIVKFNEGADEQGTNWVRRDDPNLAAQIDGWQATGQLSLVVPALQHAAAVVGQAPEGYERHATVALLSVDGDRGEPGLNLETIATIPAVTFVFGFGTPPRDFEGLPFFLEDLAVQRNGAYWPVDAARYTGNGPALVREAMHSVWEVTFRADGIPDGSSQQFTMELRDALQRSGTYTGVYASGTLLDVSPLTIEGLREDESVGSDREVTVALGGAKRWDSWRIELFRDCLPDTCAPVAGKEDGVLDWRLIAGPLEQGRHDIYIRVFARTGDQEFVDTHVIRFERAGTGWNLWTPIAILGAAVAATVPVVALARGAKHRRIGDETLAL